MLPDGERVINMGILQSGKYHASAELILYSIIACSILFCLYVVSTANYLLFHGLVELASIVVAFTIFVIVWNTRRTITNTFFLVIGISFLFTGSIDLVHMLAYKGMGVFPGNSSDLPTQLWIAARYFQSIAFLIATLLIGKSITKDRKYDAGIIFAVCTAAFCLLMASIFWYQNFPNCFIDGTGLTPFKIASEYVISAILILAIIILALKRSAFDPVVWKYLVAAQVFLIVGELAFTSYASVYGFMNMLGHLAKLVSVYFFYRAVVVIAITRPFDLLFSELKEKSVALQQSEARYSLTLDAVNDGLWDWNVPSGNAFFSPRYYTLLGYKEGEFPATYDAWRELIHPEDRAPVEAQLQHHVKTDTGFAIELRMKTKSGDWIWVTTRGMVVERDAAGAVVRMVGTLSDITERKRIEEERTRLVAIVEQSDEAIIGKTLDGIITSWNTGAERMYGYSAQEIIGKSVSLLVPQNHPDDTVLILERVKNGEPVIRYETLRRKKDGGLINVTLTASPIRDPQNHHISISIIGHDITERKRAEVALQQANKQLNLLSSITRHDILNQLMALKGYLSLSHEVIDKPTILTGYIQKEEQAANTIEHQIKFTKDYQELGVADPTWQNVNASIKEAVDRLQMRAVHIEPDPANPEVYADPLFEKVFYNLIDNALRYGGDKMKTIQVSSQESDTGLKLVCEDDGVGITDEDKKKLFRKGFGKHTGLGLFLSREILAITGITITENGVPGTGARFEIHVPAGMWRTGGSE